MLGKALLTVTDQAILGNKCRDQFDYMLTEPIESPGLLKHNK